MEVPRAWLTDLAVHRLAGALVSDRHHYLAVMTAGNPGFHWGNCLVVTDPARRDEAAGWVMEFRTWFPTARHRAIGLPSEPDPRPWAQAGLAVESELVLATASPLPGRPLPDGFIVRQLEVPADWAGAIDADLADNRASGSQPVQGFGHYLERLWQARARMSRRGEAAFLGAFTPEGELVARLGIVLCGPLAGHAQVARYQHVGTRWDHRGRGLAGHLLGVAAAWAGDRGADLWEIHVDEGTPAHRLYASLGFVEVARGWQAFRAPDPVPDEGGNDAAG